MITIMIDLNGQRKVGTKMQRKKAAVLVRRNFCLSNVLDLQIKHYEERTGEKLNVSKICRLALIKAIKTDPFQITTA